ncbi:MAG TPA: alpha/beta fold hydrolase [Anaerolinea sp.]|nr:alpha/beta fold hydrolase [Anaerolinea sp.]
MQTTPSQGLPGPFFNAARTGNNRWWVYLLTLTGAFLGVLTATTVLLVPLMLAYPSADVLSIAPAPLVLAVTLLPFGAVHLILWVSLRFLHRRPPASLYNPGRVFRWRLLWLSGAAWLLLSALVDGVQYLLKPELYRFSFDPGRFWPYLPVALLLLPLQTSAEELVFRGYLPQAFGLRARSLWLPLLLPALLFGLLHIANPEVATYGFLTTMPLYLGIGLILSWITLRSQGLEMAFGLHLANNLYSGLVTGLPNGALPSATLFTMNQMDPMLNLILFLAIAVLFVLFSERLLSGARWHVPPGLAVVLLLGAGLLAGCAAPSANPTLTPTLALEPCLLTTPGLSTQVEARCGKLAVPENPADPSGRQIELNVAVIKAQSSNPAPDPLVLLAGGPGQAATQAFLPVLPALNRVAFKRDILLIDQRGTGQSNPLGCAGSEDVERPIGELPTPAETAAEFKQCLAGMDADPRYYTTAYAMQDLDHVRKALGYQQVNLLGVSYGTRAALTYMRLYPQNVRTAVLDAVVPPGWVIGQSVRRDAQTALESIIARCEADPACKQAFPDLAADLETTLTRLAAQPAEVTVPDPISGADTRVVVNPQAAGAMLRLISYSSDLSALIPWLVHTSAQGDLRPLASQYLLAGNSIGSSIDQGMFYAVLCSEDIPFLPPGGEPGDYFFYQIDEYWQAVCAEYPANPQAAADRAYPTLEIPTLIISGSADPITPPENGATAAQYLPNSRQIVMKGMGHGNMQVGCVPDLIRQALEDASVQQLDTTCIQRSAPLPFFLSPIGPEP